MSLETFVVQKDIDENGAIHESAVAIPRVKYVLISPARNEAAFIHKTLDSVVAQTHLPERWVIVDDGSTDRTGAIVEEFVKKYPWIELVRRPAEDGAEFRRQGSRF